MVGPRHADDLRRRHAPRDRARARRRGHEARLGRIRRALVMSLYCVHGFLGGPWDCVIADWSSQPVFGGHRLDRPEQIYSRSALAAALREWSPGVQEPLAPRLATVNIPTLWIAGARDTKYVAEAERGANLMPRGEGAIIQDAGHR